MVVSVPLVSANLASFAIESALYGFFLLLSALSIYAILKTDGRLTPRHGQNTKTGAVSSASFQRTLKRPLFIGGLAMIGTVTGHWICSTIRLFLAVLKYEDPTLLYGQLSHPTEVAKTGLVMASLVLGDSMLIYRLWVVWNRNLSIIVFPLISNTGLIVAGVGITYQLSIFQDGHDIFVSEAGRWITTDTVLTLCTNLYCSSLIALRIWNQSRETSPFLVNGGASNLLTKSFIVFVESAALYTIWTIISLATYESKSPVQFFMINCYAAIAGIAFMSINARMFLSSETIGSQKAFSSTSSSNSHRGDPGPGHTESTDTQDSYQLHAIPPVAVKINHIVEQRADPGSSGKEELYPSEFKH